MALKDYEKDMWRCVRCSECKWIPQAMIKSWRFAHICPSIEKYNFHAYSAGGRMMMALAMLTGRIGYTNDFLDILYRCNLCGACDAMCKNTKAFEPLAVMHELRAKAVEDGELLPVHMLVIEGLKKEDNMMQRSKAERGKWAEGLDVKDITKEKAQVYYHAGCRYCFDEELWPEARDAVILLRKSGIDVGIAGKDEACCGARAWEMGYLQELTKFAEHNMEMLKVAGVKTLVTSCAECYYGFKVLYAKLGLNRDLEVLHVTEYLAQMIKDGRLKFNKKVPITVTYHDPCHMGRLGEPYIPWHGTEKKVLDQVCIYDSPKPWRRGRYGVYEPPRDVLRSIPGLQLVEMERIKEYAWCCGAGGGVKDAYPDYAISTALERIEEAKATGAEALVTACSWCKRNFVDAVRESGERLKVYDAVELVRQAI
jgi:Fe-S oxidoreductase